MYCIFTLPYRMTTYYSIHAYDQNSHYHADEDLVDNHILYKTFERACDAIEERIRYYESEFEPPNREDKARYISKRPYVHYYEASGGFLFVISKMTVEEEKKNIGKCWYCGDLEQTLNKDGMCLLCSLK